MQTLGGALAARSWTGAAGTTESWTGPAEKQERACEERPQEGAVLEQAQEGAVLEQAPECAREALSWTEPAETTVSWAGPAETPEGWSRLGTGNFPDTGRRLLSNTIPRCLGDPWGDGSRPRAETNGGWPHRGALIPQRACRIRRSIP